MEGCGVVDEELERKVKALEVQVQEHKKITRISTLSLILLAGTVILQGFRIHDIYRMLNKIVSVLEKIAGL